MTALARVLLALAVLTPTFALAQEPAPATPVEAVAAPVAPVAVEDVAAPAESAAPAVAPAPAEAAATVEAPAVEAEATPTLEWKAKPGKGLTASMSDESFEMNIRGRFMLRGETIAPKGESAETNLMVRRARLTVAGYTFSKDIQYYMQMAFAERDFESGNVSPLYDAYITLTHLRDLNVKLGQYMVPHDRARVISSSSAQLVDRSPVVSALNLGREVGVQLSSEDLFGLGHILAYQVGFFGGEGRNARGFDAGFMYTGRIQLAPFGKFEDYKEADIERDPAPRLAIGLGAAYNQNAHRPQSNQGTPYDFATFNYLNLEADVIFKVAGFSFLSEVMYRGANKRSESQVDDLGETQTEHSREGWGFFTQAGYMLTDHFEVAGRYSQLFSRKGTDPDFAEDIHGDGESEHGIGHEVVGGLSWYVEGHNLKLQADYAYLFGDAGDNGTHEVRVQGQTQF